MRDHPKWYNASSHNCTMAMRRHVNQIGLPMACNWRILAKGYLDQLAYSRGSIDTSLPFDELRRRSEVTAGADDGADDFSARLRAGLPGMGPS